MFTAVVLTSAALAGIKFVEPATQAAAPMPSPVPTLQAAPVGVARAPVVIGAYVPATQAQGAGLPIGVTANAIDANTADDTIIDVPDDTQSDSQDMGLSRAVTSHPADV